jgi:NAD+ kinase
MSLGGCHTRRLGKQFLVLRGQYDEPVANPTVDLGSTSIGLPRRIGLVVHPTRNVDGPLRLVREWSQSHGVDIAQVPAPYEQRHVAAPGDPGEADLIVSVGGDGTTLAALRTAALVDRPVLGVACGSLGALATVSPPELTRSLERFSQGDWIPRAIPALSVARPGGEDLFALNDVAIVRGAGGQVRLSAYVDGTLFTRIAGDGAVVSTPIGSSGYAISAGGPLVLADLDAFVLTPLPKHGGFAPPLVIGPASELTLDVHTSFGGPRLEIDGQIEDGEVGELSIRFRRGAATMVAFDDQEPLLAGLRRRGILLDSPRVVVDAGRGYGPGAAC